MTNLSFSNNSLYTIGVEEEYMICDPLSGELTNKAYEIMNLIPASHENRFSYELLLSEIESNTPICHTVDQAINEILICRNILNDIGKQISYKIGMSGTHPTAKPENQHFIKNH